MNFNILCVNTMNQLLVLSNIFWIGGINIRESATNYIKYDKPQHRTNAAQLTWRLVPSGGDR